MNELRLVDSMESRNISAVAFINVVDAIEIYHHYLEQIREKEGREGEEESISKGKNCGRSLTNLNCCKYNFTIGSREGDDDDSLNTPSVAHEASNILRDFI